MVVTVRTMLHIVDVFVIRILYSWILRNCKRTLRLSQNNFVLDSQWPHCFFYRPTILVFFRGVFGIVSAIVPTRC